MGLNVPFREFRTSVFLLKLYLNVVVRFLSGRTCERLSSGSQTCPVQTIAVRYSRDKESAISLPIASRFLLEACHAEAGTYLVDDKSVLNQNLLGVTVIFYSEICVVFKI